MTVRFKRKDLQTFGVFILCVGVFVFGSFSLLFSFPIPRLKDLTASVFFVSSVTTDGLRSGYKSAQQGRGEIGVLIVPGHDDRYFGTSHGALREADLTRELGEVLKNSFRSEKGFNVTLLRDQKGFIPEFENYFAEHRGSIERLVRSKKEIMANLINQGLVHEVTGIVHNSLAFDRAIKLYAVNQWANEMGIDLVIHVHFNDYPGRKKNKVGKYNGFSVYVPESQYSNSKASIVLGQAIERRLKEYAPVSNMPKESIGVIEDQELIAIGAYNTLDGASVLIEYGYIYEPQFTDKVVREKAVQELAHKTYVGIKDFFGEPSNESELSTLLPYTFKELLSKRTGFHPAALSLQTALALQKVYPPEGLTKNDCPVSGYFGSCTELALSLFQKSLQIKNEVGFVGPQTQQALTSLYGE